MRTFKSPRMQRIYDYLNLHRIASTKELEDACGLAAARDYVRRLRDAGVVIRTIEAGTSKGGARIVQYELVSEGIAQPTLL